MNNNKLFRASILILSGFMLASNPAQASIFKCVNQQGSVYYNDKPCPEKDKETQLKAIKDPKNGYIPLPVLKQEEEALTTTGIVVGKNSIKERGSKDKAEKREDEEFHGDNASEKTQNSNHIDSTQSSTTPPASFTMGNNTEIPTVREDLEELLGNVSTSDDAMEKYLSKMVH